jgi:GT2 family glycosyltransferase
MELTITKVSVVIPVYGQWDLVERNVKSLLQFDEKNIREILIVDDCSPESHVSTNLHPLVTILKNKENLGYSGTVNNGLRCAQSDLIVLLDSDAYLIGPIVENFIKILKSKPLLGCLGFSSVGEHGQTTGSFQLEPTLSGYIVGQALEARFQNLFKAKKNRIVPLSCCVGFRKRCLEDINYFDAETFPGVEADVDLALRIHQSQWKVEVTDLIKVYHQGGNSYKINSKRVRLYHAGKWNLLRKHEVIKSPELIRLLLTIRIQFEILVMMLFSLMGKHDAISTDKLHGRRHLLKDVREYQ